MLLSLPYFAFWSDERDATSQDSMEREAEMLRPLVAATILTAVISGNAEAAQPNQTDDVTAMLCAVFYGSKYFTIEGVKRIHESALRNGATEEGVHALLDAAQAEAPYIDEPECQEAAQSLK
jgi:hypothetical protein